MSNIAGRAIERRPVAIATLVFLCMPLGAWGQNEWTWKDASGGTRTRADLDKILNEHKARGTPVDLSGAHLRGADLTEADLGGADLSGAGLDRAHLHGADLHDADIHGADLFSADLSGTKLEYAELKGADFYDADLQNAVYEPKSNPEIGSIADAEHLELLTYEEHPNALFQLRKEFQDNGFRTQERKITYALNRRRAEVAGPLERWFNRVAFDLTCQYGMNPGRALKIWTAVLFLCWFAYALLIHLPGESGIYRIQRQGGCPDGDQTEVQIRPRLIFAGSWWTYASRMIHRELAVVFWAGFFSLMSAFNVGFRDIDFGRWLRLLPRTEYDLRAKGWARTVAGFQSLLSVYPIGLWALTYFGRPFE